MHLSNKIKIKKSRKINTDSYYSLLVTTAFWPIDMEAKYVKIILRNKFYFVYLLKNKTNLSYHSASLGWIGNLMAMQYINCR